MISKTVGFIGLGRMGRHMAMNVNKSFETYVWNRTHRRAVEHSQTYDTKLAFDVKEVALNTDVIILCLPTYKEVFDIVNDMTECLKQNHVIIDCSSSDPFKQIKLYAKLQKHGVSLLDAPVSGGPSKANLGTLSSMVGGDYDVYLSNKGILESFSKPIYVGKCGNGCAIKCINNLLNMTNLCVASEGLKALSDFGIEPNTALDVINASSGRSLMTTERIPVHVLERGCDYGFSMKLMQKDIDTASKLISLPMFAPTVQNLMKNCMHHQGEDADYTSIYREFFRARS